MDGDGEAKAGEEDAAEAALKAGFEEALTKGVEAAPPEQDPAQLELERKREYCRCVRATCRRRQLKPRPRR